MKFIRQEKSEKRIKLMLTNKRLVEAKRPRNSTHNATAFFSESSAIGKVDCGSPEQSNRDPDRLLFLFPIIVPGVPGKEKTTTLLVTGGLSRLSAPRARDRPRYDIVRRVLGCLSSAHSLCCSLKSEMSPQQRT